METINQRIKKIREHLGLTQAEFCRQVGISTATLSHLEKNKTRPSFDVIESVTDSVPKLNLYWLIKGKGEMFLISGDEDELIEISNSKPMDGGQFGHEVVEMLLEEKEKQLSEYREREKHHLQTITSLSKR